MDRNDPDVWGRVHACQGPVPVAQVGLLTVIGLSDGDIVRVWAQKGPALQELNHHTLTSLMGVESVWVTTGSASPQREFARPRSQGA